MEQQAQQDSSARAGKTLETGLVMKRILLVLLILPLLVEIASAQSLRMRMLERQAARAIRNAGFWCDKVSDARVDQTRSAMGPTIVQVTCDDKTAFAQYQLTMTKDNKIAKIETWK
jgi:hypothetical protein